MLGLSYSLLIIKEITMGTHIIKIMIINLSLGTTIGKIWSQVILILSPIFLRRQPSASAELSYSLTNCPTMFWTTHVPEFHRIGSYYKFTRNHHSSLIRYDQNIFKIAMTNGCYNLIYHLHWKLMKGEEPCYY